MQASDRTRRPLGTLILDPAGARHCTPAIAAIAGPVDAMMTAEPTRSMRSRGCPALRADHPLNNAACRFNIAHSIFRDSAAGPLGGR